MKPLRTAIFGGVFAARSVATSQACAVKAGAGVRRVRCRSCVGETVMRGLLEAYQMLCALLALRALKLQPPERARGL